MSSKSEPYLLIAGGGFAGACTRYLLNGVIPGMAGIMAINVIGCYLLGVLMYESIYVGAFSPRVRLAFGIGFIGAFTTFSTFSLQAFQAAPMLAMVYIALSLLFGFIGVYLGRTTTILLARRSPWKR